MTLTIDTVQGLDTFEGPNQAPLGAPYLTWREVKPDRSGGSVTVGLDGEWSAARPEQVGPNAAAEIVFDSEAAAGQVMYYVAARLQGHEPDSDGYSLWVTQGGGPDFGWVATLYGPGYDTLAVSAAQYGPIRGMSVTCAEGAISGLLLVDGAWTVAVEADDERITGGGLVGFGIVSTGDPAVSIGSFRWGAPVDMGALAARFYSRVTPIAVMDRTFGYPLRSVVRAITRAGEAFYYLARGSETHTPWGKALDPDYAPASLLKWLALFPGVRLQPGDTEAQQRYRIRQAAGFYQSTARALVEELQLVLTGTKTVLLGFHDGDQWHYSVGTLADETPDPDAVARAVEAQNPAGMEGTAVTTDDWSWLVLAPSLIAHRETVDGEDTYVIDEPEYPTWQSVIDAFSTWQHLIDNDPDL